MTTEVAQKRLQRYKNAETRAKPRLRRIERLALGISDMSRKNTRERFQAITGKDISEEDEAKIRYGTTIVCNACGSINVSILECFRHGEYDGYEMRCNNCEKHD